MDFDDTPEEAAFRADARAWLAAHAAPRAESEDAFADLTPEATARHVARCTAWQRTLYEHGWAGLTWPVAFGGRGLSSNHQGIFNEEAAAFDAPTGIFAVGIGMVGPTLIAHAADGQKARYLDPLLRGEEVWCQLFSEPGAGSDLAAIRTRAVRDGDEWVVNGQKVWTSGAHYSDFGILLARTDGDAPKHKGITYFIVDMRTPGIEVRPLYQIDRSAHFNEVFLTDVRIPHGNIVGEVGGGWGIALTTLANERALIGGHTRTGFGEILGLAQAVGGTTDARTRQALAACFTRLEVLRFLRFRVQTARSQGRQPGPEASVMKLLLSRHLAETGDLVLAMEGAAGMLYDGDARDGGFWQRWFLGQWRSRIGGGTDQIQRNVIGERVLGLPAETRVDKDVPFRQLTQA